MVLTSHAVLVHAVLGRVGWGRGQSQSIDNTCTYRLSQCMSFYQYSTLLILLHNTSVCLCVCLDVCVCVCVCVDVHGCVDVCVSVYVFGCVCVYERLCGGMCVWV